MFCLPAPTEVPTDVSVKVLSSSEISVSWHHVSEKSVEGYQVSLEVTLPVSSLIEFQWLNARIIPIVTF